MLKPKQPVINAVLITYIDYSITENYIGKMASFLPYTRPEPVEPKEPLSYSQQPVMDTNSEPNKSI